MLVELLSFGRSHVNAQIAVEKVHTLCGHGQDRAVLNRNFQIAVDRVLRALLLCVLPVLYDLMNLL
jgi:hypothetical protein